MCSLALLHPWFPPSKAPMKIGRSTSSILTHDRMKKSNFLRRFQLLPHLTESKMCSICSFTSLISPFESTLKDWEVMSSILTHDRMKKIKYSQKISTFSTSDREQKFLGASPPRHPLEILAIENVMGWIQMINPRNLYLAIFFNNRGESLADALGTLPRPRGPLFQIKIE